MAIYTSLPVYKESYTLCVEMFAFTRGMAREYKYTLGERLKNQCIDLILIIYEANRGSTEEKQELIGRARKANETIRLLFRLCLDLKLCSMKNFVRLSNHVESISKQLAAWQKYYK